MADTKSYRILIAKPGLDGHDRGAKVIVRSLRDAGFEVIYTGIRQTAEMIARTAIQEDVDAVGLSLLSGAHLTLFPKIVALLRKEGLDDVLVFGGGIIPDEDVPLLQKAGVSAVFGPGTSTEEIVSFLHEAFAGRGGGGVAATSDNTSAQK
jgi:methylmalonyl-CoA mutase C-terminal domain/subunit